MLVIGSVLDLWPLFAVAAVVLFSLAGYAWNNRGPGDYVREPNVKARRNNRVPRRQPELTGSDPS